MLTPIIILGLLFLPLLAGRVIGGAEKAAMGGILGIALAFIFFGIGHYAQTDGMIAMLPDFVPMRRALVLATGVLEFAIALGFLFQPARRLAGIVAIAVLILFFPANIYAAFNQTGLGGHQWGPFYLPDPSANTGAADRLDLVFRRSDANPAPQDAPVDQRAA